MANIRAVGLTEIQSIVSSLYKPLITGYGPSFQHTVISTASGKVLITNKGTDILKTFNISHPIAQFIISCVSNSQQDSGDDSKTFMVLLNELLKRAESVVRTNNNNQTHQRESVTRLAQDFGVVLRDILPALFLAMDRFCIQSNVAAHENRQLGFRSLIMGAMNSHLLEYDASHMANLLVKWLLSWCDAESVDSISSVINFILDNFNALVIQNPGRTLASSSLLPGVIVSRGFCNINQRQPFDSVDGLPIKFILLNCPMETASDEYNQQIEFQLPDPEDQAMVERIISQKRKRTEEFLRRVETLGPKLLLTAVELSTLEKTLCSKNGIAAIHTIPEEELGYISAILHVDIVSNIHELDKHHIGQAKSCNQLVLGSHSHVNIEPVNASAYPSCLVVSAPTDGICFQVTSLISDSLKIVRGALSSSSFTCQGK